MDQPYKTDSASYMVKIHLRKHIGLIICPFLPSTLSTTEGPKTKIMSKSGIHSPVRWRGSTLEQFLCSEKMQKMGIFFSLSAQQLLSCACARKPNQSRHGGHYRKPIWAILANIKKYCCNGWDITKNIVASHSNSGNLAGG